MAVFYLKKLAKGSLISAQAFSPPSGGALALKHIGHSGALQTGTWTSGKAGYAGVKLSNGDYGWVELVYTTTGTKGPNSPYPGSLEVLGDAYATNGGPITAGEGIPEAASRGAGSEQHRDGAASAGLRRRFSHDLEEAKERGRVGF